MIESELYKAVKTWQRRFYDDREEEMMQRIDEALAEIEKQQGQNNEHQSKMATVITVRINRRNDTYLRYGISNDTHNHSR